MAPAFESVVFIQAEAEFVQSTMFSYSQNQALGGQSDSGSAVPVTRGEITTALSILSKVRKQLQDPNKNPISFTESEAQLMTYLYIKYIAMHGKPQGDLDWTYWVRLDDSSRQIVINVIRKLGGNVSNLPATTYPQGFNPFPRL